MIQRLGSRRTIASGIALIFFCGMNSAPPVVLTSKTKPQELFELLTYPARVTPEINTQLIAETDGIVSDISAALGQKVQKGSRVLSIRHTDPVYQYAPATVLSPIQGIVSALEISPGTQVSRGQRLGTITDPNRLKLTIEIPAQDLAWMHQGLAGEFKSPSISAPLSVKIKGISPFVDPGTGTAPCQISIESRGRDVTLTPGMVGQVTFKTHIRKGISIPEHALLYRGDQPFVRIVEDGKAKRIAVKLGNRSRGAVEILEGLSENATLIERASRFVADGEAVTLQESTPEAGAK